MKKSAVYVGTTALLILTSNAGWAGPLTVPNTFVTGTKAVAADVNANFAATKAAVDGNAADISTNAADITTNANAIATKADASSVTTNAAAIANNATAISSNTAAIAAKADATDVTTNAGDIAINAADISANATAINAKADAADVTTNANNITSNAANISANTTSLNNLQQNGNPTGTPCAGNDSTDIMVRVGPLCVDKYEASVWNATSNAPFGTSMDNYPDSDSNSNLVGCDDNGHGCAGAAAETAGDAIFARSEPGVLPSRYITWFQAAQACANSGKRLLTNAEWQVAAAGTDIAKCNIPGGTVTNGGAAANTDANPDCVSNWGVVNMAGNVNEWVAEWIQGIGEQVTTDMGAAYDNGLMSGVNLPSDGATFRTLAAIYRGGGPGGGSAFTFNAARAPSYSNPVVGFRCAR